MAIPLRQKLRVVSHILAQRLRGRRRFPLVLMLEPLFQCNLACTGCGKIAYPKAILKRRMSVAECLEAAEECGAPVVSIAGGEPLLHEDLPAIVAGLIAQRRHVYLCTNGLLLGKRLSQLPVSPFLTISLHLDGRRQRHDAVVGREGVYERAVAALKAALALGHRVTVNCTVFSGEEPAALAAFLDEMTELGVGGITVAPGFAYERAPGSDLFLDRTRSRTVFRALLEGFGRRRWPLNHSPFYLEFLAGRREFDCTPWGSPTRNVFGWQRPCYLLNEGSTERFAELLETTSWDRYGSDRHPQCSNCMAHCGYEPTAVIESFRHPLAAIVAALRPRAASGPPAV